jgi:hypothetical protein
MSAADLIAAVRSTDAGSPGSAMNGPIQCSKKDHVGGGGEAQRPRISSAATAPAFDPFAPNLDS